MVRQTSFCKVNNFQGKTSVFTQILPLHSERVALMVVLIDLYRITSQAGICSFDRHLCQQVAVNWNLAGTGRQGQLWALESTFEIQKSIF